MFFWVHNASVFPGTGSSNLKQPHRTGLIRWKIVKRHFANLRKLWIALALFEWSQNGILWNYSRKSAAKKRETLSSESFRNFFVAQFWGSFKSKWEEACVARQHVCLGHLLRGPMIGSPGTDAKL
jgi:hypothetical protein